MYYLSMLVLLWAFREQVLRTDVKRPLVNNQQPHAEKIWEVAIPSCLLGVTAYIAQVEARSLGLFIRSS